MVDYSTTPAPDTLRVVTDARFREIFEDKLKPILEAAGWTVADNGDGAATWTPPAAGSGSVDPGQLNTAITNALEATGTPWGNLDAANGGTGAYPARPATARPVTFRGLNQPPYNGSTSGGGGMVPNLDEYIVWQAS